MMKALGPITVSYMQDIKLGLVRAVKKKRRDGDFFLHHDNAQSRSSVVTNHHPES